MDHPEEELKPDNGFEELTCYQFIALEFCRGLLSNPDISEQFSKLRLLPTEQTRLVIESGLKITDEFFRQVNEHARS